MNLFMIRM